MCQQHGLEAVLRVCQGRGSETANEVKTMKYDTQTIEAKKIILCILEGKPDVQEAVALALSLRKKASEVGYNVLYDARKLQVPSSIMPAYDFSTKLSSMIDDPALRVVKVAFLYDAGQFDDHWKFWETASVNRGLQFRGFTDEGSAMNWLSG